jgi:hypothetical protein
MDTHIQHNKLLVKLGLIMQGKNKFIIISIRLFVVVFLILLLATLACDKFLDPEIEDYCLYFDGQDDKVIVYDNDDDMDNISDQITLEAWIYLESLEDLVARIIDRSDNQLDDRYVIEVYKQNQQPIVHLNINRNSLWSQPISLKRWVHIAGTYDGENLRMFIDGALHDSLTVETIMTVNESDILIGHGGLNSEYSGAFHGYLNELSIWNIARTQEQLQQDMKENIDSSQSGLVCYWPVKTGTGQRLVDSKRNADGQLGSSRNVDDDDPVCVLK